MSDQSESIECKNCLELHSSSDDEVITSLGICENCHRKMAGVFPNSSAT